MCMVNQSEICETSEYGKQVRTFGVKGLKVRYSGDNTCFGHHSRLKRR